MITISENKISANQTLKPNDSTEKLAMKSTTITVYNNLSYGTYTESYTITDSFVDEIQLDITRIQWDTAYSPYVIGAQTFSWKALQSGVTLYSYYGWILSVTCSIDDNKNLQFTYKIESESGLSVFDGNKIFKIQCTPTVRGAKIIDDLTFQDGFMKISSIIDYQEKISLGSNQSYTIPYNCIAIKNTGTGGYGGIYNWVTTMEMYTRGTKIAAAASEKIEFYIYLIFRTPEDESSSI